QLLIDRDRGRLGRLRGVLVLGRALRPGHLARLERCELDELGDAAQVHDLELGLEWVLEAAQLGDALVQRRLAALEPGRDRAAGARLLALRAATRGLSAAGRDAPADAGPARVGAGRGAEVVELHAFSLDASGTS